MTAITKTEDRLKNFHFDRIEWKSGLQFIEGEIQFINQLLNSYVFEPNTPNLFERLQEFKTQIEEIELDIAGIHAEIRKQESELGGMLECDTVSCDTFYDQKHTSLKKMTNLFLKRYKTFKAEVFSYAGGILKKKKK